MRRRFGLVVLLFSVIVALGVGCSSTATMNLREAYSLSKAGALQLNDSSKGIYEVRAFWVYSTFMREVEEGQVFSAAVRQGGETDYKIYKMEAATFDPKAPQTLIIYLPEEMKWAKVLFFSHDGNTVFGRKGYYADHTEEPDWEKAIVVEENEEGVRLLKVDTPERAEATESYLEKQQWLVELVAKSPALQRELKKEEVASLAKPFMAILRLCWSAASFGWAEAIGNTSMYNNPDWKTVWEYANYAWSLEKIFQLLGIDLTDSWKGYLATAIPSRRESVNIQRRREALALCRGSKKQAEYEAWLRHHFGDGKEVIIPSAESSDEPSGGQPSGGQSDSGSNLDKTDEVEPDEAASAEDELSTEDSSVPRGSFDPFGLVTSYRRFIAKVVLKVTVTPEQETPGPETLAAASTEQVEQVITTTTEATTPVPSASALEMSVCSECGCRILKHENGWYHIRHATNDSGYELYCIACKKWHNLPEEVAEKIKNNDEAVAKAAATTE